jgi:hypothetical protein
MVSLAFILSFVVSAVAMLIGIVIFSEVTEAMAETLPVILVEIPTTPEVDGKWFIREHCPSLAACHSLSPVPLTRWFWEYRILPQIVTTNGFDGVVKMWSGGLVDPNITQHLLGKVFDKEQLDGKLVTWEVSEFRSDSPTPRLILYDGELDPTVSSFNGTSSAPSSKPCGVDCFQDTGGVITSGSGGGITIISNNIGSFDTNVIFNFTGTGDLSSFDSPTGKVTLIVSQQENGFNSGIGSHTFQITIEDLGTYRFKSDPANSWSGSTLSPCIQIGIGGCVNSLDGNTESYWTLTSLPPPPLPVFNSEDTLNANEVFNNAKNIGFTVIGILPIALFFGLFAVFSGRGME